MYYIIYIYIYIEEGWMREENTNARVSVDDDLLWLCGHMAMRFDAKSDN